MLTSRITALFPDDTLAEAAIKDLRAQGVSDKYLATIKRHAPAAAVAGGAAEGLAAGAGIGALFGLAAALIPGVGPFIAAGFFAPTLGALAGGAAAGAVVGGSAGLVAGALAKAGYAAKEAEFLGKQLDAGNVLVAVETGAAISSAAVASILAQHGGRLYTEIV